MSASDPLNRAYSEIEELDEFVTLCNESLGMAANMERLAIQINRIIAEQRDPTKHSFGPGKREHFLKHSQWLTATSKKFLDAGLPHLYRMATAWLWAILEASIDDMCVHFIREDERWRQIPALLEIKGPLLEFATAPEEARARMLLDSIKLQVRAPLKVGIGRFEEVLNALGLGGGIDADVRRTFVEFSESRNVMVHRRGLVDADFVKACPWLEMSSGDALHISNRRYRAFYCAVGWYYLEIIRRLWVVYGHGDYTDAVSVREMMLSELRKCIASDKEHAKALTDGAEAPRLTLPDHE